jgi:hypothetical protein
MKETFLGIIEKIKHFFSQLIQNPLQAYLILMGLGVFYLIGLYFDWKWTASYNANSNSFWRIFLHENYTRKSIRTVYAIVVIIMMIGISFLFYSKFL